MDLTGECVCKVMVRSAPVFTPDAVSNHVDLMSLREGILEVELRGAFSLFVFPPINTEVGNYELQPLAERSVSVSFSIPVVQEDLVVQEVLRDSAVSHHLRLFLSLFHPPHILGTPSKPII